MVLPGALRGWWRRRRARRAIDPVGFWFSPEYKVEIPGVPYDASRGERVLGWLLEEGLAARGEVRRPPIASIRALSRVHDTAYLEALDRPDALTRAFGVTVPESLQDRALDAQRRITGGTVRTVRRAAERGGLQVNLGGGLHHALPDRAQGFCIFNDVAVAIRDLRQGRDRRPILVVDLDLHDGDGVRAVFAADPTVFTLSIHNRHWGPTEAVASIAVEMSGEVEDAAYLAAVERHLDAALDAFRPELVVYLAGADPAEDDPIGNWRITAEGMLARDRLVVERIAERCGAVPWAVVLAGGYGNHAWRYTARFLGAWLSGWKRIEPPTTSATVLRRYRGALAALTDEQLTRESDDSWLRLTPEDLAIGPGQVRKTRWLGALSPLGVELLFERTGFLDRIREIGFSDLRLRLDLDNPAGETLSVHQAGRAEPLVELRVTLDRATLPGMRLLAIEWLLLQNPAAEPPPGRPALPGQRHPGLGLLTEMMALLVSLAERLELDGLSFVPSQYHLAVQGHRYLPFLRRDDHRWFEDLRRRIGDLPLAEASRRVAAGAIADDGGRPIAWRPMPMILPLSERLRGELGRQWIGDDGRARDS